MRTPLSPLPVSARAACSLLCHGSHSAAGGDPTLANMLKGKDAEQLKAMGFNVNVMDFIK